MVPLDPKTGSTLEKKKPLEDGRQPPPSNPNNNPKHIPDNSDKVSNCTKQKRQKHDYFYSFIIMNLLYEDMHDTTYDDLQTHTKHPEIDRGYNQPVGDQAPDRVLTAVITRVIYPPVKTAVIKHAVITTVVIMNTCHIFVTRCYPVAGT